jgi:hypothetical protein
MPELATQTVWFHNAAPAWQAERGSLVRFRAAIFLFFDVGASSADYPGRAEFVSGIVREQVDARKKI